MTDTSNNDRFSEQQSQDEQSSARGRAYGLSGIPGENGDDSATGSAAGDASQNQQIQQDQDNGLASDAMGSGAGSDLMNFDDDEEGDEIGSDMDKDDNSSVIGGR